MGRPSHPQRPHGWFRLVHEEYVDVYRWFPDASEALVCSMLRIDELELREAILRYRSYRRTHRWEMRARAATKRHNRQKVST